ncbi:glutaminase A [Paenibacillus marinisediminis]
MDWENNRRILPDLIKECRMLARAGAPASYIPRLANAPIDAVGISMMGVDGVTVEGGDTNIEFTLQSVSKVFSLLLALIDNGEERVFSKVGMEPTGDDYNSMLKLELVEPGIPFNPYINAGAIVIASLIKGRNSQEKSRRMLDFVRLIAGDDSIVWDEEVYVSERETANRNRSLAYFLASNGVLEEDVEDTLDVYFRQCSILVTCTQLARMALVLAKRGKHPITGEQLIAPRYVQIAKSFMVTCGMYNASGKFAINVGIPAKSGVSGGIMAVIPRQSGICVFGPSLDDKGNSIAGVHLLETLSRAYDWYIY